MEKIEYKGIWWLPSNPDDKVAGILTLIPEKGIELELFGIFLDQYDNVTAKLNSYNNLVWPIQDIILGVADKEIITLCDCNSKGFSSSCTTKERYKPLWIILGHHFQNIQDISFFKIGIQFNGLPSWMNHQFYIPYSDFWDTESQEYCFKYVKHEKNIANLSHAKISLSNFPEGNMNIKKINLYCSGQFNIETKTKLSLVEWMKKFVSPLCDFLTFATNQTNEVRKIYIYFGDKQRGEVLNSKMDFTDYDPSLFSIHDMLFTLNDIQDDFSLVMQRWFNMYQNIESVLNSYFGVQYNSKLYGENQFLMLAQAVESYHRNTKRNHVLSKEGHDQRIETILDSTPEEYQEWLKEKLNFSNELTLEERVEELVSLHWLVMKNIVLDKDQFVKDVKNTRNYYTHFSENLKDKVLRGEPLLRLTQKLNFLLQACFLSELGCTPEKCLELISRNGEYTYLQRLVNQEKAN